MRAITMAILAAVASAGCVAAPSSPPASPSGAVLSATTPPSATPVVAAMSPSEPSPAPRPSATAVPTPATAVVTSDDGRLALAIPDGALPPGTRVSITAVPLAELPPQLRELVGAGTGYRLQPDGLQFSQPVQATLTIPRAELDDPEGRQAAYALVLFGDQAGREVLDSDTAATLGGDMVTVTAAISHFSWISRTKGSLEAQISQYPSPQGVGAVWRNVGYVKNLNPDRVILRQVRSEWLQSGAVAYVNEADGQKLPRIIESDSEFEHWANSPGEDAPKGAVHLVAHRCASPGKGTYTFSVSAASRLKDDPSGGLDTRLRLALEAVMQCVEPGAPQPTPTGSAAPTSPPAVATPAPGSSGAGNVVAAAEGIYCVHTKPGVESEVRQPVRVVDAAGQPVAGATVDAVAQGPGLIEPEASTVTDARGEGLLVFRIRKLGPYGVTISSVTLSDGAQAALVSSSVLTGDITVTQACTPP